MPEGPAARGHLAADAARGRRSRCACRGARRPANALRSHFPALMDASACGDVAGHGEQQGQRELRRRDHVPERRVHDQDARGGWPPRGRRCRRRPRGGRSRSGSAAASSTSAVIWLPLRIVIAWYGPDDLRQLGGRHRLALVDLPALGLQEGEAAVAVMPFEDEDPVAQALPLAGRARRGMPSPPPPCPAPRSKRWPRRCSTISRVASRPRMSVAS